MLKSLEEDYEAGYISDEKYKELFNRYQKVLREMNKRDVEKTDKAPDKKADKPISQSKPSKDSSHKTLTNDKKPKKQSSVKIRRLNKDVGAKPKEDFISKYEKEIMSVLIAILIIFLILTVYIIFAM